MLKHFRVLSELLFIQELKGPFIIHVDIKYGYLIGFSYIQSWTFTYIWVVNKHYENGVIFREQKYCMPPTSSIFLGRFRSFYKSVDQSCIAAICQTLKMITSSGSQILAAHGQL